MLGDDLPLVGTQPSRVGCGFPERLSPVPTPAPTPQGPTLAFLLQTPSPVSSSGAWDHLQVHRLPPVTPSSPPALGTQGLRRLHTSCDFARIVWPCGRESQPGRTGTEELPVLIAAEEDAHRCRERGPGMAEGARDPARGPGRNAAAWRGVPGQCRKTM